MVAAAGVRIGWRDVPAPVRRAVEDLLGGPVVEAVSQVGGFSPGTADRVRTAAGRRAFVKAVGTELNAHAVRLHRREAGVAGRLPPEVPAPRLLGVHDTGDWVAVVLDDVEGHLPAVPPTAAEAGAVEEALRRLAAAPLPASLADLPALADDLRFQLRGWRRVLADRPPSLPRALTAGGDAPADPVAAPAGSSGALDGSAAAPAAVARLALLADGAPAALAGDRLVHADVRADNLLVRPDGEVVIVDWPFAARGAPLFDLLSFAVNLATHGDPGAAEGLLGRLPGDPPRGQVDAVLAGVAGYFVDVARRPPPPGLPTVRAYQAAQGDAVLDLLRRRGVLPA